MAPHPQQRPNAARRRLLAPAAPWSPAADRTSSPRASPPAVVAALAALYTSADLQFSAIGMAYMLANMASAVLELQRALHAELAGTAMKPDALATVGLQRELLKKASARQTWLVVLDDIWTEEQLEAFASLTAEGGLLGRLVTTRNDELAGEHAHKVDALATRLEAHLGAIDARREAKEDEAPRECASGPPSAARRRLSRPARPASCSRLARVSAQFWLIL